MHECRDRVRRSGAGCFVAVPRPTGMTAAQMRETLDMVRERAERVKSSG